MYLIQINTNRFYLKGDDIDYNYTVTSDKSKAKQFSSLKEASKLAKVLSLSSQDSITVVNLEDK